MLLPGCNRCGQCGCVCGKLPYTMTVEFNGLVNRTHSSYCQLAINSNFGCGATAVATAPGGCDDDDPGCGESNRSPLAGVLLTNPGHDYARLGRKQPTLTITGSGTGATFTPTLAAVDGTIESQCRSYELASVAVSGGSGYTEGETLTIVADGETVTPAVAILHISQAGRVEPALSASVAGGSGAALSVTTTSNGDSPETWGVAAVSVTNGGTGYPFAGGEPLYLSTLPVSFSTGDTTVTAATATALPVIVEPLAISVFTTGSGNGFAATLLFAPTTDGGRDVFTVSGITITNGGSGYQVGDTISLYAGESDASEIGSVAYTVDTVDGGGAVTALSAPTMEVFFARLTGAIDSVTVESPGSYYATGGGGGTPASVEITQAGEYFTVDPTQPACVADITIDAAACGGTGAELSATVDDDPSSPTFGQCTGITIDNDGGTGYLAWHWLCTQQSQINGEPIVLVAQQPKWLVTPEIHSCFGVGGCLRVVPKGDGTVCEPAIDVLYDGGLSPIREVEVVDAGYGYATYGRELPEWVALAYGWSFTPTFGDEFEDGCGRSLWAVESFSIAHIDGVHSYPDGWNLTWPVVYPEHSDEAFVAVVRTRQEPTVTATIASAGAGATLTVGVAEIGGQPKRWRVATVSGGGGSGYTTGDAVVFSVAPRPGGGQYGHYTGSAASAFVTVDEAGAVTSVTITSGGEYWLDDGVPQSVEVRSGGKYYRENPALTPYVSDATVSIVQLPPSAGSGAAVSIEIGDDPSNVAEFGKILSATVTSQGSGYTLLGGPQNCVYSAEPCGVVADPVVQLVLRGNGKAPEITLQDSGNFTVLRADEAVADCDNLPTTASLFYGAPSGVTATITRGGDLDTPCASPSWCGGCDCLSSEGATVDATSDIDCEGGAFNGNIENFNLGCSWTDPETDITYDSNVSLTLECCDAQCDDDGPCINKVRGTISGGILLPGPGGEGVVAISVSCDSDSEGGCESVEIDPETGDASVSLTFSCTGFNVSTTINFGPLA